MPILPDSLSSQRSAPPTGRRYFSQATSTAENPLMPSKVRCAPMLTYSRMTSTAPLSDPAFSQPQANSESVRQWPQLFNAETARLGVPSIQTSRRATERDLFSNEADMLFPYGHLPRTGGGRDTATVLTARGGIGIAHSGDKPYHRSEWSDEFAGSLKPSKWYADPNPNRQPKSWTAARPGGESAVAGRPLWERPGR
jgi:hypothetical protein